jgi:oxygen-independent coproporphyrinogen-3 oxidase
MNGDRPAVTPELLARYNRPGPRYTSYPTAPEFTPSFRPQDYAARLAAADSAPEEALSVYTHIPFCEHRCSYCGCHVVITRRDDVVRGYLDHLKREIDLVAAALPRRRQVVQYHWGGGTPTHLSPADMRELHDFFAERFRFLPGAEKAVEVDPRVTTPEHLETLVDLGFNRLSLGVQDFTPAVQEAIGRNQTLDQTARLVARARELRIQDINIDLIYGLPLQTVPAFQENLRAVLALAPGRAAVYSYAHVPWVRPNQRRIREEDLPDTRTKFALFASAMEAFLDAGYVQIGMDHFARPDDELARARKRGALTRNFMGYTVRTAPDILAFGVSGIGDVRGAYVQNVKKLSDYYRMVDAGIFPVERGFVLDADDHIRRHVIHSLMCNFELDFTAFRERWGEPFATYFAAEIEGLRETIDPGFYTLDEEALRITPLGQVFVRNVVMVFDRYLESGSGEKPIFSRTV